MDHYAEVIGAEATEEDYLKMAAYFEKNENHYKAGVFYFKASQFAKVIITFYAVGWGRGGAWWIIGLSIWSSLNTTPLTTHSPSVAESTPVIM